MALVPTKHVERLITDAIHDGRTAALAGVIEPRAREMETFAEKSRTNGTKSISPWSQRLI